MKAFSFFLLLGLLLGNQGFGVEGEEGSHLFFDDAPPARPGAGVVCGVPESSEYASALVKLATEANPSDLREKAHLNLEAVTRLDSFLNGADGKRGTEDDGILESLSQLEALLGCDDVRKLITYAKAQGHVRGEPPAPTTPGPVTPPAPVEPPRPTEPPTPTEPPVRPTPTPVEPPRTSDLYAAIAFGPYSGRVGVSRDQLSADQAVRAAQYHCATRDCAQVSVVRNGCLALAAGRQGISFGQGHNSRSASTNAIWSCPSRFGRCGLVTWVCTSNVQP